MTQEIVYVAWLISTLAAFVLASYGVLREAFANLAQPRPWGEGRYGEGPYGGPSRRTIALFRVGTKLGLLPGDRVLTLADRQRNAACTVAGVTLGVVSLVLDAVLQYPSAW